MQDFIDYYEKKHVPLILSLAPAPVLYKRRYLMRNEKLTTGSNAVDFDVMTELVFPDRASFLAWMARLSGPGGWSRRTRQSFLTEREPKPTWSRNTRHHRAVGGFEYASLSILNAFRQTRGIARLEFAICRTILRARNAGNPSMMSLVYGLESKPSWIGLGTISQRDAHHN
jgi:hypothetical protein